MAYSRPLTDYELEEVCAGALNQLADSVREYNTAKQLHADSQPNQVLAVQRLNVAKESLRLSLHLSESLREQIEHRYQAGNPVE